MSTIPQPVCDHCDDPEACDDLATCPKGRGRMFARGKARFVRMFQPQFAARVESGQKRQTVRVTPKRMPTPGGQAENA